MDSCTRNRGQHTWDFLETDQILVQSDSAKRGADKELVALERCVDCNVYRFISMNGAPLVKSDDERDLEYQPGMLVTPDDERDLEYQPGKFVTTTDD